jgi:hypothetical protein
MDATLGVVREEEIADRKTSRAAANCSSSRIDTIDGKSVGVGWREGRDGESKLVVILNWGE